MSAKALSLASVLLLFFAVAEAQVFQPVSDERSVSFHCALGPPCAVDTTYENSPPAPFAPFNESIATGFGSLSPCVKMVSVIGRQNSAVLSDSIGVYEYVTSDTYYDVLRARVDSDLRIRFSVQQGTRYDFRVEMWTFNMLGSGDGVFSSWLSGPEPSQQKLDSLRVQLERGVEYDGGYRRDRATLAAGTYVFEAHAWAEAYPRGGHCEGDILASIKLYAPTAVESVTWDRVKALYRSNEGPSNRVLQPPAPRDGQR